VQAGQILAAAIFLPLAHYMPDEAFNTWGWRIPFLLSFFVIIAGYIIRRNVDETPAFAEESEHGEVQGANYPGFKLSWRDMLRVVCMALMNVIPVVASIFGAAYAVQAAYGIGFPKDVYLWIPVLGNILAVLVIPYVGTCRTKSAAGLRSLSGALGSGLLAFGYLYAISIHSVPLAISCRCSCGASSTKAIMPLSRAFTRTLPDPHPRLGDRLLAERPGPAAARDRRDSRYRTNPLPCGGHTLLTAKAPVAGL